MNKGVKFLLLSTVILAFSVAVGFFSVVYIFDTVPSGQYRVQAMLVDGVPVQSGDDGYDQMLADSLEFAVKDRSFVVLNANRLGQNFEHRLRGGFVSELFLELRGQFADGQNADWIRFDGSASSLYEKVTVKEGVIYWQVAAPGQVVKTWVYRKV